MKATTVLQWSSFTRLTKTTFTIGLLLLASLQLIQAGSATWSLNPPSNDWNTAGNWTPATIPNGPSDAATFDLSNVTNLSVLSSTEVNAITFTSGAPPYTITANAGAPLTMSGIGAVNNSAMTQNFVAPGGFPNNRGFVFFNSATAGTDVTYTIQHGDPLGGAVNFNDSSTAGAAAFVVEGGTVVSGYGIIFFNESSSAGDATFISEPGSDGDLHGDIVFSLTSTAGNATFLLQAGESQGFSFRPALGFTMSSSAENATVTAQGATSSGVVGQAAVSFGDEATAGNATLIALGGTNGGNGGQILFVARATGGTARVEVFGNGNMDLSGKANPALTIGSLEGDGNVFVGRTILSIGSNNLNTLFSGVIQDGSVVNGGGLTKIGTGILTLTGANTYTGSTLIRQGTLVLNNRSGSATGVGPVNVNAGTIAGRGTITGPLTVGTGSGSGALLAPGNPGRTPGTFTVQNVLTVKSDATYQWRVRARDAKADQVIANGATIESGAQLMVSGIGHGTIAPGTVLTLIRNTAGGAILGTFSNLADGGTITIGQNTFQANYEGGDGNDLTLTVVP